MQSTNPLDDSDARQLSTLVNSDRIRSSIKRLFRNRIDEILGEIFQNAQRAGATTIAITTTNRSFTIQDDGHGLLNGIDGFHTLLKLAESHFDNDTIDAQDPMGLGIVSLLTHDQISEVTFSSGLLELTIDTQRWWTEPEYYSVWYERLITLDTPVAGLRIFAQCSSNLAAEIDKALKPKDSVYSYHAVTDPFESASPAQGYDNILMITLNNESVRTSLPAWTQLQDTLVKTTFQGSKLRIGYNSLSRKSSVLWYGQLIPIDGLGGIRHGFNFHLEVTSGRPVNPLSPSRTGIIHDAAYQELLTFVKDKLFTFIFDLKNRKKIKRQHIEGCYSLDEKLAFAESPYILAEELEYNPNPNSFEDFTLSQETTNEPKTHCFFTYSEAPLLLNESVFVQLADAFHEHAYGISSFLPQLGKAFTLKRGDPSRLAINTLWWKPEGNPQHGSFYQPGSYGISPNNKPPRQWTPITSTPVFTFNDTTSYDVSESDLIVGCPDILSFLQNQVWAIFSANDNTDYDPQEESFRRTVDDLIRTVIGNCVPRDFTLYDLRPFFSDEFAPIISINYHYRNKGKSINPTKTYRPKRKNNITAMPSEVTATNALNQKIRLKLY